VTLHLSALCLFLNVRDVPGQLLLKLDARASLLVPSSYILYTVHIDDLFLKYLYAYNVLQEYFVRYCEENFTLSCPN
jgi:hypothetical protein